MNDPYSILGASPSDSDEEIKKKYRELVKKYHPDNYHDNPLADLAQEKMKEINEAYDMIQKQRECGETGGSYSSGAGNRYGSYSSGRSYSSAGSPEFAGVRSAINSGELDYAERVLRNSANRNAEWNFLMGSVCYRKGWLDDARKYYQTAVNMDPGNEEYRQALGYMQNAGAAYRPAGFNAQTGIDPCDICTALACMNCLCGRC